MAKFKTLLTEKLRDLRLAVNPVSYVKDHNVKTTSQAFLGNGKGYQNDM